MTDLRDRIAMKAMAEIMRSYYAEGLMCGDDENPEAIAHVAYMMADAMLRAREAETKPSRYTGVGND